MPPLLLFTMMSLCSCHNNVKQVNEVGGPEYGQSDNATVPGVVEQLAPDHPIYLARSKPDVALSVTLRSLKDQKLPTELRTQRLVLATTLGRHRKDKYKSVLDVAGPELQKALTLTRASLDETSISYLLAAYDAVVMSSSSAEEAWTYTKPILDQLRGTGVEHSVVGRLSTRYRELSVQAAEYLGGADAPVPGLRDTKPDFENFADPDEAAAPDVTTRQR